MDDTGQHLKPSVYGFLRNVPIQALNIVRESDTEYSFTAPMTAKHWTARRLERLRVWITSIVLCSPELSTHHMHHVTTRVVLREAPTLSHQYDWIATGHGQVTGIVTGAAVRGRFINLMRRADGVCWDVS